MNVVNFSCSECGYDCPGDDCAISMTIDCPNCEGHTTAYKSTDSPDTLPPLPDTLDEIRRVWDGHDDFETGGFPYVAFVIQQDIKDMADDEWDEGECIEELADVCINSLRMMMECGYDPTVEIQNRVRNHEQKDTDALVEKYQRLYRESESTDD